MFAYPDMPRRTGFRLHALVGLGVCLLAGWTHAQAPVGLSLAPLGLDWGVCEVENPPAGQASELSSSVDGADLAFVAIGGAGAAHFAYTGPLAFSLDTGEAQTLDFTFTPPANDGAAQAAQATFAATGGASGTVTVTLTATTARAVSLAVARGEFESGAAASITYRLQGIVNANNQVTSSRGFSMQDRTDGDPATRGVSVFDPTNAFVNGGTLPALGQTVEVLGTIASNRGLMQLTPTRAPAILASGASLLPVATTADALGDATESVLLQIPSVSQPAGLYAADTTHTFSTPAGSLVVYLPTAGSFNYTLGAPRVAAVTGIGHQRTASSGSHPLAGGGVYRLQPRFEEELPVALSAASAD